MNAHTYYKGTFLRYIPLFTNCVIILSISPDPTHRNYYSTFETAYGMFETI